MRTWRFHGRIIIANSTDRPILPFYRLSELDEVYIGHQTQLQNLIEEEKTLKENVKRREGMIPALGKRYEFYQDLREYISILVECLDEKVLDRWKNTRLVTHFTRKLLTYTTVVLLLQLPIIEPLEKRVIDLYQKKANEMIHRRRQDVKDQLEDLTQNSKYKRRTAF